MNLAMKRRLEGTAEQNQAQRVKALAMYSLHLQRNTQLNAEQRLQALKAFAMENR